MQLANRHHAAIHIYGLAGDERRLLAEEESDDGGHFVGPADSAERHVGGNLLRSAPPNDLCRHRRIDQAGRQGIDPGVRSEAATERARQTHQASLRDAIRHVLRRTPAIGRRRDED